VEEAVELVLAMEAVLMGVQVEDIQVYFSLHTLMEMQY
jgi:hypothetical protein